MSEIIRAFLLEEGDVFRMFEQEHTVLEITDSEIIYGTQYFKYGGELHNLVGKSSMGKNSKQRILLISCKQSNHHVTYVTTSTKREK